MTNEVVKAVSCNGLGERLPPRADLPDLPLELARAVRTTEGEVSDRYLPRPGDVSIRQAIVAIPAYAAGDEAATDDTLNGWLDRVALAVVNAPGSEGRKAKGAAFIALSGDLPRVCWTLETWQAFMRRGPDARFWPAAAEVDGFLRPIAEQHRAKLATLRRIAAVGSKPERPDPSPPELVSEVARMTLAERDAAIAAIRAKHGVPRRDPAGDDGGSQGAPPPVRAIPVSDAALQAIRDRRRAQLGIAPLPKAKPA